MKIRYCGDRVVDVGDHLDVHPGDVIEVPDEQGESLLLSGATHHDKGDGIVDVVLPEDPTWVLADDTTAKRRGAKTTTDVPVDVPADTEKG